ncbi:AEC family transporter [Alteromonas sp. D210916BOD_24]
MGWIFHRIKWIDDAFVQTGSSLVFNVALPALLFLAISQADFSSAANLKLIGTGIAGTFILFSLLAVITHFFVTPKTAKGVVVQGGFRANIGVVGLAYCASIYDQEGFAIASVYMGCLTILFNILSVFILNFYQGSSRSPLKQLKVMAKNPLIIAIVTALAFSYYQWKLPQVLIHTGEYFAQLTLPLALICTGASLQFRSFSSDWSNIAISTVSKCIIHPLIQVTLAYVMGLRKTELGIALFFSIAPTAAASYVMVRTLGGDPRLAASIIAISTLASLPITALAFGVLHSFGLL